MIGNSRLLQFRDSNSPLSLLGNSNRLEYNRCNCRLEVLGNNNLITIDNHSILKIDILGNANKIRCLGGSYVDIQIAGHNNIVEGRRVRIVGMAGNGNVVPEAREEDRPQQRVPEPERQREQPISNQHRGFEGANTNFTFQGFGMNQFSLPPFLDFNFPIQNIPPIPVPNREP